MQNQYHVLLIEHDPDDAELICKEIAEASPANFRLTHVNRFAKAQSILDGDGIDAVLMNLQIPDGDGLDSVAELTVHAPHVPVIIVTDIPDETIGMKAIKCGAQDYLIKEKMARNDLIKSLTYSIERQRRHVAARPMELVDDITGLYSHLGFVMLGEHLVKLGERGQRAMFLVFLDIGDFKRINNMFGRTEGDRVLKGITGVLHKTFRGSDIVARVGPDEFAVLGIHGTHDTDSGLTKRLEKNLAEYEESETRPYHLSVRTHLVHVRPKNMPSLADLLTTTREAMSQLKPHRPQTHA